ncbi:MAG TPA: hypothetical protein DEQ64_14505 [Lachnoclostridium sp.]|uniref:hypothetical protein n=1 Tax=Lacrimispora sp. TaxID=2719234 RepID=UPI000EC20951|nr:hypothetical protein [Lacrimispora sp.]HCD44911.1 hypothetical protein [Lachnoclostridium sp.]
MSKPWYYTIGYPVKVLHNESWLNGIICYGYRHEDGIITTMTEEGKVWFGEPQKDYCLKPNLPDDNPWIPTKERLPKDSEYARVYMTIKPYTIPGTIKGNTDNGKFYYANGKPVQCPVLAWKYLRYPKPYKEES